MTAPARRRDTLPLLASVLAAALVVVLVLPIVALALSASPRELVDGARHELFGPALWLSLRTSLLSLAAVVVAGTPLAFWLSTTRARHARVVELLVDLPIVIPPAVVGVALLHAYGRQGLLGSWLTAFDISLPFTTGAVVLAQIVVSAPFYVQAAANAFRKVEPDMLLVARTLGASPTEAIWRVAVPVALPGIIAGAALAWARSLGEFGATLLFAGNLPGTTQTMPLAIYTALESDVRVALAIALVLGAIAVALLLALRMGPDLVLRMRKQTRLSEEYRRRSRPGGS